PSICLRLQSLLRCIPQARVIFQLQSEILALDDPFFPTEPPHQDHPFLLWRLSLLKSTSRLWTSKGTADEQAQGLLLLHLNRHSQDHHVQERTALLRLHWSLPFWSQHRMYRRNAKPSE